MAKTKTLEQEAATILRRTKRILKGHWTKGRLVRGSGENEKYCLVGGLRKAAFGDSTYITNFFLKEEKAYFVARNTIKKCIDTKNIPSFNDHPSTKFEDINNTLNCAIKKLTTPTQDA